MENKDFNWNELMQMENESENSTNQGFSQLDTSTRNFEFLAIKELGGEIIP